MIMAFLVLSIDFLQNIMDLSVDVLNMFNEFGHFISLHLRMGQVYLCGCKGKSCINRGQWLKPRAHLKRYMASRAMKSPIVAVLNIRKIVIPCVGMFGVIHA